MRIHLWKNHQTSGTLRRVLTLACFSLLVGCAENKRASGYKIDPTKFALHKQTIDLRFHFATDKPTEGFMRVTDDDGQAVYVEPIPLLTEQDVVSARAHRNSQNQPCVTVTFNGPAGARLAEITGESIGEKLAIFADDKLISCPTIVTPVSTKAQISGDFTEERAQEIATALSRRGQS